MSFPPLIIGELVAQMPIVQGGMAVGVSLSGLASAVAEEGGIGVIATAGIGQQNSFKTSTTNAKALMAEFRRARSLTAGIVGVNVMVALCDYASIVKAAFSENADIIFSGAGLPFELARLLRETSSQLKLPVKTKLVPIVSSARAAKIICNKWLNNASYLPDAVVVEGPEAGGHLGFMQAQLNDKNYALDKLVPEVIEILKTFEDQAGRAIPVIAAGGIFSGDDIRRFHKLGAAGVQMGTRFIATHECDADYKFKMALLNAGKNDVVVIQSPLGLPGRVICNEFTKSLENNVRFSFDCPFHCLKTCSPQKSPYCIADALLNAVRGNLDEGFVFSGTNAGRVNDIISVKQLVSALRTEYDLSAS